MPPELTRLVAVNRMMTAISMPSVDTLDENVNALVATAVSILDETELELVSERWYFNTEDGVTYDPDPDGNIFLGSDVLHADSEDPSCHYVKRGNRLYDKGERTFVFLSTVTLTILRGLMWEELPVSFRDAVTKRATQYLAERFDRDGGLTQRLAMAAEKAYTRAKIEDGDMADANILVDNPGVRRLTTYGRGPLDRGY